MATDPVVCLLARSDGNAALERVDARMIIESLTTNVSPGFDRFPARHERVARALAARDGWRLHLSANPRAGAAVARVAVRVRAVTSPDARSMGEPDDAADASRRATAFERSGNPADLWPGLTERSRVGAARELERITREVLAGRSATVRNDDSDAYALGVAGHTTGMGPVVGRWIEDGRVSARAEVVDAFARHLDHGRRRDDRIEREVLPALDACAPRSSGRRAQGIPHVATCISTNPACAASPTSTSSFLHRAWTTPNVRWRRSGFQAKEPAHRPYKRDWIGPGGRPAFLFSGIRRRAQLVGARAPCVIGSRLSTRAPRRSLDATSGSHQALGRSPDGRSRGSNPRCCSCISRAIALRSWTACACCACSRWFV